MLPSLNGRLSIRSHHNLTSDRSFRCNNDSSLTRQRSGHQRWSLRSSGDGGHGRPLEGDQGDVVLLLPVRPGEPIELAQEELDELRAAGASVHEFRQPREAEHLALGIVGLDQAVAVQQHGVADLPLVAAMALAVPECEMAFLAAREVASRLGLEEGGQRPAAVVLEYWAAWPAQ